MCYGRRLTILNVKNQSSGAITHLRAKHNLMRDSHGNDLLNNKASESISAASTSDIAETMSTIGSMAAPLLVGRTVKALYSQVDIDQFRWRLVKWVVYCHIILNMVGNDHFRDLIIRVAPSLLPYLISSGTTIRAWIGEVFNREKVGLKQRLKRARSRIYVSCDLWTSPSQLALLGIVLHYLDDSSDVVHVLGGLRRVRGTHSGENVAAVVISFIREMDFEAKLRYFIGDNASTNDTCWHAVLTEIGTLFGAAASRIRCLGHIINLIAKDFIFSDSKAFLNETASKDDRDAADDLRRVWRR